MNACATARPRSIDEALFWTPSAKQEPTLRRLDDRLFTDGSLIDDGD